MTDWLNYQHLHYFWTVAQRGSVTAAARELRLAPSTVSAQVGQLEEAFGIELLEREGRGLRLTEAGQLAAEYAGQIVGLGRELLDAMRGRLATGRLTLQVGVADVLPKLMTQRLLAPAFDLEREVHLVVREDDREQLLLDLGSHQLDVVLTDAPLPRGSKIRAYSHELGRCDMTVFAHPELAADLAPGAPNSLDGAPWLLPTAGTTLRSELERWFEHARIAPRIVAELDDSALVTTFGQQGMGLFVAPSLLAAEIERQFGVRRVLRLPEVSVAFYAVSLDRRLRHPAVLAIVDAAHEQLFDRPAATPAVRPDSAGRRGANQL